MKVKARLLLISTLLSCQNPIKDGGDCQATDFEIIDSDGHAAVSAFDSQNHRVSFRFYETQGDTLIYTQDYNDVKWPKDIPFPKAVGDSFYLSLEHYGWWEGSCGFRVDSSLITDLKSIGTLRKSN